MTNYKQLCTELVRIADAFDGGKPLVANQGQALDGYSALAAFRGIAASARAALAEPEPEGPTVMEIIELADEIEESGLGQIDLVRAVLARWGRPAPGQAVEALAARPLMKQVAALGDIIGEQTVGQVRTLADRAAAWLAANPPGQSVVIEPVPVSERLPGAEDCDAEGRCWWWYPPVPEQAYGYWAHEDDATDRAYEEWPSAWLPAYALPLPTPEPQP